MEKKEVLAIVGSTRPNSINELIIKWIKREFKDRLKISIYNRIDTLPFFRSDITEENLDNSVREFYRLIEKADAVLICTPEYIFSIPGALKNALEWTVATTLFTDKPVAIIVASSLGQKASEELILIMSTLGAKLHSQTSLLISGVKSKFNEEGVLIANDLRKDFNNLETMLIELINNK